jgi:hypothetical protein
MDIEPGKAVLLRSRQLARLDAMGCANDEISALLRVTPATIRKMRETLAYREHEETLRQLERATRLIEQIQWNALTKDSIDVLSGLLNAPETPPAIKLRAIQTVFDHSPIGHFRKDRNQRPQHDGSNSDAIRLLKERAAAIRKLE